MLLTAGIRGGDGNGGSKRFFSKDAAVVVGDIHRVAWSGILAAAPGKAVRGEEELFECDAAVVGGGASRRNDFVPAGDCGIYRGSICGDGEVKRSSATIGILALLVLAGAAYLWVGSAAPPGQEPLVTLSQGNFAAFETSFDRSAGGSRLVLLLSPT